MMCSRWFFIGLFCFTVWGCSSVQRSISDYERCKNDSDCASDIQTVKDSTYVSTKSVLSSLPIGLPDAIALIVSNLASFGVGVVRGRKKRS